MTSIFRNWWPVFIALALVQMGNGLAGTLVSVSGEARNISPLLQGLILSAFFAGSLGGAYAAPHLIAATSHSTSAFAYTLALVATVASFAVSSDPWAWVTIRFIAGAAITGIFATIESWLNLSFTDTWRARVFSLYIFIQLVGLASGQLLLSVRFLGETTLFIMAAAMIGGAAVCLRSEHAPDHPPTATGHISIFAICRRAPVGILCICLSGFSWAGMMASGPALVEKLGLSDVSKSAFMALAVISGMLAQLPAGYLADHMDRRRVLAALTGIAASAALLALAMQGTTILFVFAVAFGAATFPLYAVGVALSSEALEQSERTSASALMIIFFDLGAVVAPMLLAFAMSTHGASGYFLLQAIPQLGFAALALLAASRANAAKS